MRNINLKYEIELDDVKNLIKFLNKELKTSLDIKKDLILKYKYKENKLSLVIKNFQINNWELIIKTYIDKFIEEYYE